MFWAHLALQAGCWAHWEDSSRYLLSASITQRVPAKGSSPSCAVWALPICRLLDGNLPRHAQGFSSTLESHTKGCQSSPCLVATGPAVAGAATLTSMQQWLPVAPWTLGWYRPGLLQMLMSASCEALFGWVLHSLCSYSPSWSICIHLASIPRLCRIMPWHHLPFPHLWWRWRELPPTQEMIFKINVFMSRDGYGNGYTKFHWRGLSCLLCFWSQEKGQERKLLEHVKDSNSSVKDTLQFLYASPVISR